MLNQKQGVYSAVSVVMEKHGVQIREGTPVDLTAEQKKQVIGLVSRGIIEGEIEMKPESRKKHPENRLSKSYVNGLVNNWLRKDTRLNGGKPYQPKNRRQNEPSEIDHGSMQRIFNKSIGLRSGAAGEGGQAEDKREKVEIDLSKLPKEIRQSLMQYTQH